MLFYIILGVSLLIWLVLSWFVPAWVGLVDTGLWVLRGGLLLFGILGAVLALLLYLKKQKEKQAMVAPPSNTGVTVDELIAVVQEAEKRLATSQSAKGQKLSELPLYFVIGDPGTTKTSMMVHSGLEPELLAGLVYQETSIVPTRTANIWYARNAIFAEVAGRILDSSDQWTKFVQRLRPGKASKATGGGEQAPRAVIVCVNSEVFLQPNANELLQAHSRKIHARLLELAQTLGIRFPVYVMFTKVDRIAYFAEFVAHLTNEEAGQVVGVTLPYVDALNMGVYAEEQTRRISDSFNRLFKSVADKRPLLIRREPEATIQPSVYEFPREFRKVQNALVSFLVDLCRPSQLSVGPFLRGYYFGGIRPVYITDVIPSQPKQASQQMDFSEATSMFNAAQMQQLLQQRQAPKATGPRRVPQWVFFSQFFNKILLGDQNALRASSTSTQTSKSLRLIYASIAGVCLLYSIFLLISFFKNRAMEQEVIQAVRQLPIDANPAGQLATLDQLTRLEQVRAALVELSDHQHNGKPLMMRWGLYAGDKVYPLARRAYFQKFQQLLLAGTQANMQQHLASRQGEPDAEGYRYTYDTLKAYLITTSHADKSKENQSFLPPVLMERWLQSQQLDAERMDLARKQFEFYTQELQYENPYSPENDKDAVARSRAYLSSSQPIERIYQFMLSEAGKKSGAINFPRLYPAAARVMSVTKVVNGAFTKPGYDFMMGALKNIQQYISGEEWVLGPQSGPPPNAKELEGQIKARYYGDFKKEWREFVASANVLRYASLKDAAAKLSVFASNSSPLLALFSTVSRNTAVEDKELANLFQPPQFIVPPDAVDKWVGAANQPYMTALASLQTSVETASNAPPSDKMAAQATLGAATNAKVSARQIAQNFVVDTEGRIDAMSQKLLEDPITNAEALIRALGPAEMNGKGAGFCNVISSLWQKYPFSGNISSPPASLEDVNAVFQPGSGALWNFYQETLASSLENQAGRYVAKPDAEVPLNPQFVAYFNEMARVSAAFYPGGSTTPSLNYTLSALPMGELRAVDITLSGATMKATGRGGQSRDFTWPGQAPYAVDVKADLGGGALTLWSGQGLWEVYKYFHTANEWDASNNLTYNYSQVGAGAQPIRLPSGQPLIIKWNLNMKGAPPVLRDRYLAGLRCVSRVAR
jgi:type VI secretion system protein ImpL